MQQLKHYKATMNFIKLLIAGVGSPANTPSMSSVLPKSPTVGPSPALLIPSIPAPYISPTLGFKYSAPPPPAVVSLSDVQPIGLGAQNGCIGPGPVQTAYQVLQLNQTFSRFLGFAQQAGKSVICIPILSSPQLSLNLKRDYRKRTISKTRGGALWWAYTFVLSVFRVISVISLLRQGFTTLSPDWGSYRYCHMSRFLMNR